MLPVHGGDGVLGIRFQGIGHSNEPGHGAVQNHHHDRMALGLHGADRLRCLRIAFDGVVKPIGTPHLDLTGVDAGGHTGTAVSLEILDGGQFQIFSIGRTYDGLAQGMFGSLLDGGGPAQQFFLALYGLPDGHQVHHGGLALGDGAGFIQNNGIQTGGGFQCLGLLEKDAFFRAFAGAGHNGSGGGQPQCAGAGDDQHGNQSDHGRDKFAGDGPPYNKGDNGDGDHAGDKDGRHPVGQPLNGGLAALGFLNQTDDLGQSGFFAGLWWR